MALPASKHRAKEMKRLGWVWWPQHNAWVYLGPMDSPEYVITFSSKGWDAVKVASDDHFVRFDCPIAAAIWISVEYADEIAADKERTRRGWEEHIGYSLPA